MIRLFFALLSFALLSCGAKGTKETGNMPEIKKQPITSAVPDFNADSAYAYVANQVAFGPRVPNTAAHKACGDYLASELKRFGAKVYQQEAILTAYDGTKLEARNIIGSFDPENSKRVLLFAHWDSRPYSDHDPDPSKHRTPLDGADDGGSGVGALLEIARQIGQRPQTADVGMVRGKVFPVQPVRGDCPRYPPSAPAFENSVCPVSFR